MNSYKKAIAAFVAAIGIAGVFIQFYISMRIPSTATKAEVIIRFFSYFTILSNLLVIWFFGMKALAAEVDYESFSKLPETATAITVYIVVVGLIYQFVLRGLYHLEGIHKMADNIIHGFTPTATLLYWIVFESKRKVNMKTIPLWLIYPGVYLVYTLIRGYLVHFYPYPFVDVDKYGLQKVLMNSFFVMLLFLILSFLFAAIAKKRHQTI